MLRAHLKITKEDVTHKVQVVADQPSRSFLLQFCSLMARQWMQVNDTCKDTAGQSVTEDEEVNPFRMTSIGGYGRGPYRENSGWWDYMLADERGIVIGTDNAAVQPDQYAMVSQVRSGETSGKVMYYGTIVYGLTINATTDEASFKVEAIFHNKSGGTININEVGIFANGEPASDSFPNIQVYCIIRDVLASQVELANDEYLKVTYTISIAT